MRMVIATGLLMIVTAWVVAMPNGSIGDWSSIGPPANKSRPSFAWPPKVGSRYPDLELVDQLGNATRLSEFSGKVILIEPIGLPCKACQAFCGGHELGGFRGVPPQPNLPSMKELSRVYGNFDLSDNRIVKVYLILYGSDMRAPSPEDLRAFADHFRLRRSRGEIVLGGTPAMVSQESYEMIPGAQLVDRNFVLRLDATGRADQTHDLYRELLPAAGHMLSETQ